MKNLNKLLLGISIVATLSLLYLLFSRLLRRFSLTAWLLGIIVAASIMVGTASFFVGKFIYHRYQKNPMLTAFVCCGIILTLASVGLYYLGMEDIRQYNAISIVDSRYYQENGLIGKGYFMQYQAVPSKIDGDTGYKVIVDNGEVKWEDNLYWMKDNLAVQTVKHEISQIQYESLKKSPYIASAIYEVSYTHNAGYLLMPFIYAGIVGLVYWQKRKKPLIIEGQFREI